METMPERRGWRRDDIRACWINGTVAITDETIVAFPRSKVQLHAVDMTGEPLPPQAFAVFRWPTPRVRPEVVILSISADS